MHQQVIDGEDVGECPLKDLEVCLGGGWVVLNRPLGSLSLGEGCSQLPHTSEGVELAFTSAGVAWEGGGVWGRQAFLCRGHWDPLVQGHWGVVSALW